ncbi:hypothetical protein GQ55_9G028800 [Panicum hallii var. hallii]|uniref:Uncharacterized protein n=1 Tax=Panicum hallii var. hallii TaxID=1504633 RepID=A0A2T7BYZ4_9POAL|nr:hypothetical protein GQ55_9G028800 [Panicum hallii var. hallii]
MASASPAGRNDGHNNDALLHAPLLPSRRQPEPTSSVSTDEWVLSASANLLQLLPTGSVMVFQTLSPSLTNQGECHPSNWWLSLGLVLFLTFFCFFSSFTDSFFYDRKLYYGMATPWRLFLFNLNLSHRERKQFANLHRDELEELRLRWDDYLHAVVTAVVFVALAFSDIGIQNCFFPHAGFDAKQWLKNMPLVVATLSSLLLMLCQTRRNNVDFLSRTTAHPSVTPDPRRPEYGRLDSIADHQNLNGVSLGFPRLPVEAMLQTRENRMTSVHDNVVKFRWERDDLLMLRWAPHEMPRIHSESNLQVPSKFMDMV